MDDLEMKMGIKIEAVRDMMLDRFSGVDQKLTAIEQLLKQLIEPQNQTGNSPEKRCDLTEQNTDKGTECPKYQDEGKKVAIEGCDGGTSHECGPNKVGGDDRPSHESGPKVAIEGGDDGPSHEPGSKKPFRVKVSLDDDDQETDDQMQGPLGVLNFSDRSIYGPPREAGRSCGWAELHTKHYGTYSPHRPNYSFGKGFCGPAWVGLQETDFSKKNGPHFGSKVVNADVTESGLKFGCQKGVLIVQDDIYKDFLKSNHLVVKTGQGKTDAGGEEEHTCSLTPQGKKSDKKTDVLLQDSSKLVQWAKKDFGPVGSVESVKGLDWSTLIKTSTDSRGSPWGYTGDNKPQEQVLTNRSTEGGPKAPRRSPTVKKADVTGCVGKKSENDTEKGAKRTSQDYFFLYFSKFNRLGTYNSWMGSSGKKVVKTGQDDILKNSWTGSWNGWSSTEADRTDVLLQDSSKLDPWANSGPLGKAVQIETVCEPGSVECNKGLDWSKLVEVKTDLKHGWGLKRKHPDSPNDGPNAIGPYTTFNPHLGVVTTGEQEILREIKPIMQRIMHQKGYDVGDPLSGYDQTHMLETVFNHHPEKAQKMGARVDYIMVDEHTKFQGSWCFCIVYADGHKEDFSCPECLKNFPSGKYRDKVEFIPKCLKISEPCQPETKDCGSGPVEDGSPRSCGGCVTADDGVLPVL